MGGSVPEGADELAGLERRREELYRELGQVGDFRRGSLNEVRRKCGKPGCACAAPDHRGHGPQWNLTRKVEGRTRAVHLKPGPELEKARREVAEYERFRGLVGQVTEVNEAICQARPAVPGAAGGDAPPGPGGEKMTCIRPVREPAELGVAARWMRDLLSSDAPRWGCSAFGHGALGGPH